MPLWPGSARCIACWLLPPLVVTHLRVAGELLMGAINGTAHLMRSNLQFLKDQKERDRYLSQLSEMLGEYQKSYRDVMAELG